MAERPHICFDTESFIRMVKSHPFLYDKKRDEFKDIGLKQALWVAIGKAFQISAEKCVKKWKNLRDRYIKIKKTLNKSKRCGDPAGEVVRINWKYYDIMDSILKESFRNEQTSSCKNEPDVLVTSQSEVTNSESEEVCDAKTDILPLSSMEIEISEPECTQNGTSPLPSAQEFIVPDQSTKRKRKRNNEETTIENSESEEVCDTKTDISPLSSMEIEISEPECTQNGTSPLRSAQQFIVPDQSTKRKRKRNNEETTVEVRESLNRLNTFLENTNSTKDEVYYFTNNVACRLRKLERKNMLRTMNKIENILFEQEMSL